MPDVFGLSHKIEHAVFDILQNIRHSVGAVKVNIALFLVDKCLVALRAEQFPHAHKVLHHADVRASLDVEVARVEKSAHVQARNQLVGLVLGVGGLALVVKVEMVGRRRLNVALFERLAVPDTVALVHGDVVQMDWNPNVACGVGDFVVNILIYNEMVRFFVAILDAIDARLFHHREIEFHIIIFEISAPEIGFAFVSYCFIGVFVDFENFGCGQNLIVFVKLDNRRFGLRRNVSHLRETNVGLANPAFDGVRFDGPRHHLARFASRQHAAQHKPAVLGNHSSVVEADFVLVRRHFYQALGAVRRHNNSVRRLYRQRVNKLARAAVVVSSEPFELLGFLTVIDCGGVACGVFRQQSRAVVGKVHFRPVLRRQKFEIKSRLARKCLRNRIIQEYRNLYRVAFGLCHNARVEVVIVVTQRHLDALVVAIHLAVDGFRHKVPLLGRVVQPDGAALHGAHPVVDYLDARILLVVESAIERVAVNQHVNPLTFKIIAVVDDESRVFFLRVAASHSQHKR